MEPRVSYVLVGLFVLVLTGVFLVTSLWLVGVGPRGDYRTFAIYPPESVAGIAVESLVKYQGVDVGKVREIGIDTQDSRRVRLLIDIRQNVPIQVDTSARLATQGLTGLVYFIELRGGEPGSPVLETEPGADYPTIRAVPSDLAQFQQAGSELLEQAQGAATELRATLAALRIMMGDDQRAGIRAAIGDASQTASRLAEAALSLNHLLVRLDPVMDDLSEAVGALPGLVEQGEATLEAAEAAVGTVGQVARHLDELTTHAAPGLKTLTREGMPELVALLRDLRGLTERLDRVAADLERDPSLLIHGHSRRPGPGER
jgi:phospholipid/cholesterol/gamma-HCH transport system substrate-binding protein